MYGLKKPAGKRKSPTPTLSKSDGENSDSKTESDIHIEEDLPVRNEEDDPVRTEEHESIRIEEVEQVRNEPHVLTEASSPNREVIPPLNDFIPSQPSSPKTTASIPITMAPMPPLVSSQPSITIPVTILIFTKSTISHHTSATLQAQSMYLIRGLTLQVFQAIPFQIRIDSEDEGSTTKGELKSLHENIDQLLLASQVSTSEA
ncbi:unnamed protein product [Lactuca saligna]|uniref:Uncharacterized protein n=1 Tax=Lactuca saligna TaxID=75948 RepID=A0AA35ZLF3_LACSI|nr:unnamed protein product [Lactuca saligna]